MSQQNFQDRLARIDARKTEVGSQNGANAKASQILAKPPRSATYVGFLLGAAAFWCVGIMLSTKAVLDQGYEPLHAWVIFAPGGIAGGLFILSNVIAMIGFTMKNRWMKRTAGFFWVGFITCAALFYLGLIHPWHSTGMWQYVQQVQS